MTDAQEKARAQPWRVEDAPDDFIAAQMRAIVGVEIEITQLVGKWKASQHKPDDERQAIEQGLHEESGLSHRDSGYLAGKIL